jgi:hypothetical protein
MRVYAVLQVRTSALNIHLYNIYCVIEKKHPKKERGTRENREQNITSHHIQSITKRSDSIRLDRPTFLRVEIIRFSRVAKNSPRKFPRLANNTVMIDCDCLPLFVVLVAIIYIYYRYIVGSTVLVYNNMLKKVRQYVLVFEEKSSSSSCFFLLRRCVLSRCFHTCFSYYIITS